ncbi:hypothetical protein G3570_02675 [Balneolaceae bacterium YR4-1]|uniref:Uncharacterized protein n=1 Tax=Halalkalibaculum roseum TaxID=2709311 RepID=A0A6M1SJP6_9BACT|nr:hypothetical protein [Halalkalibaculum roseum]NGP75521.1 hypothetical protein [Halalkalibaculum roseum]
MIIKSTTYRFFSALMLMLFMGSIVLPSGLSAATLFCDMPMVEMHNSVEHCCDIDQPEDTAHHRDNTEDDCHSEKVCLHILSPDQTEVEAVVIQQAKELTVIASTSDILIDANSGGSTPYQSLSHTIPDSSPPLFLLNSTFLN